MISEMIIIFCVDCKPYAHNFNELTGLLDRCYSSCEKSQHREKMAVASCTKSCNGLKCKEHLVRRIDNQCNGL